MSEAGSRAASSHPIFLWHTQEQEFLPLGSLRLLWAVAWSMVHSTSHLMVSHPTLLSVLVSLHPALTLALSLHSVFPCCVFLPLKFPLWEELHPLQEYCVIRGDLQLFRCVPVESSKYFHPSADVFRKHKHSSVPLNIFCCSLAFDEDTSRRLVGKRNILTPLPSYCDAEL